MAVHLNVRDHLRNFEEVTLKDVGMAMVNGDEEPTITSLQAELRMARKDITRLEGVNMRLANMISHSHGDSEKKAHDAAERAAEAARLNAETNIEAEVQQRVEVEKAELARENEKCIRGRLAIEMFGIKHEHQSKMEEVSEKLKTFEDRAGRSERALSKLKLQMKALWETVIKADLVDDAMACAVHHGVPFLGDSAPVVRDHRDSDGSAHGSAHGSSHGSGHGSVATRSTRVLGAHAQRRTVRYSDSSDMTISEMPDGLNSANPQPASVHHSNLRGSKSGDLPSAAPPLTPPKTGPETGPHAPAAEGDGMLGRPLPDLGSLPPRSATPEPPEGLPSGPDAAAVAASAIAHGAGGLGSLLVEEGSGGAMPYEGSPGGLSPLSHPISSMTPPHAHSPAAGGRGAGHTMPAYGHHSTRQLRKPRPEGAHHNKFDHHHGAYGVLAIDSHAAATVATDQQGETVHPQTHVGRPRATRAAAKTMLLDGFDVQSPTPPPGAPAPGGISPHHLELLSEAHAVVLPAIAHPSPRVYPPPAAEPPLSSRVLAGQILGLGMDVHGGESSQATPPPAQRNMTHRRWSEGEADLIPLPRRHPNNHRKPEHLAPLATATHTVTLGLGGIGMGGGGGEDPRDFQCKPNGPSRRLMAGQFST